MSDGTVSNEPRPSDGISELVRGVRQVDPAAGDQAIRRFAQEIAEADAVLKALDLDDAALEASFSPAWDTERAR